MGKEALSRVELMMNTCGSNEQYKKKEDEKESYILSGLADPSGHSCPYGQRYYLYCNVYRSLHLMIILEDFEDDFDIDDDFVTDFF